MRRLLSAALLVLGACIDVPAQPAKDASEALDVSVPAGVGLETACTPTGPEICFDARDNNCNGVIDEGCGLHTGLLQFVIAWEAAEADVDLNVYDPNQELAHVGEATPAGLQKDRDCPKAAECQGQNVENVYLTEGEPRKGKYKVVVHLEHANGAALPIRVRLGVRMGSRTFGRDVLLSTGPGTDELEIPYELK
jgi:tRNA (guanosine-2'-O-)-methyltransferase